MRRYLLIARDNDTGLVKTFSYTEISEAIEQAVKLLLSGYTCRIRDNATGREYVEI